MLILRYLKINRINFGFHFEKDIEKFRRDQMKFQKIP